MNEEKFIKEHPGLKDKLCLGFIDYDPECWKHIHETQIDKQKIMDTIGGIITDKNWCDSYGARDIIIDDFVGQLKKELGL